MARGRPRKNFDLDARAIREMRTREEKLRAIFTADWKPIPKDDRKLQVALRGPALDEIAQIRLLAEVETWRNIPEEVAQLLFERIVETTQHHEDDGKKVEHLSDSAITHMALRLFRIYLMGSNDWNRRLLPKVLQVDREEATRTVFMKRFKHGAEMEAIRRMVDDIQTNDGELLYDLDDVSWDDLT